MNITRRTLIVSGMAATALGPLRPVIAMPLRTLRIADPSLLHILPVGETITSSGHELLKRLLPLIERATSLEAVVREADARLISELIKFQRRVQWQSTTQRVGQQTFAGSLRQDAQVVRASFRGIDN